MKCFLEPFERGWRAVELVGIVLTALLLNDAGAIAAVVPEAGYVFPPVVQIGQSSPVVFGVYDATEDQQWFSHDDTVRIELTGPASDYLLTPPPYWIGPRASTGAKPIPREIPGTIHVEPTATPGLVRWQVANASGCSGPALLFLSTEQNECVEKRSRDFAQELQTLPVAVSGRLARLTEVDRYRFFADQDGTVTVDLMARRLGSDFWGVLEAVDATGKRIADVSATAGRDPSLSFSVKSGHAYEVRVRDIDFRGHRSFVYRLSLRKEIRPAACFPVQIERGSHSTVEFLLPPELIEQGLPETIDVEVSDSGLEGELVVDQATPWGQLRARLPVSSAPERTLGSGLAVHSADPAGLVDMQSVQSVGLSGRLAAGLEESGFYWKSEASESWSIDVRSVAIGGTLDLAIDVIGPDGKLLVHADDVEGRVDPWLQFNAKEAGIHRCVIRNMAAVDRLSVPVFHVTIQREMPDFEVVTENRIQIAAGGSAQVNFTASRRGGFNGAIAVKAVGLPDGLTEEGEWIIPEGKSSSKMTLKAAGDVAVTAARLSFRAAAEIAGTMTEHPVRINGTGNLDPRKRSEQVQTHALVATTMAVPFEVKVVDRERQRDVPRGTTSLTELEIVRKEGFEGPVRIVMSAKQSRDRQGIRGGVVEVPPGVNRVLYPCFMPEWLGTELTRRILVHGEAIVPDPVGNLRTVTAKGDARITMILEGALMKLTAQAEELTFEAGQDFQIPVRVTRSHQLPLPVTVRLDVPGEISGILVTEPIILDEKTDRGVLTVRTTKDRRLDGPWSFRLEARALKNGKWPVVSETEVDVMATIKD